MLCWVCERLRADRGRICHICRREVQKDSFSPRLHQQPAKLAGVLIGVLSLAASVLAPALVSPPALPAPHPSNLEIPAAVPVSYVTTMVVEQVKRKIYPYSIVPGGAEDLRQAIRSMTDPAIKEHYANVDLSQLKQVNLTENLSGYVSYRWGDKIYWTAKKITLHAGETVFTDGKHIVRGRCLNRHSALPMQPTRPHEPTQAAFDAPLEIPEIVYSFPKIPFLAPALPEPPGELTPTTPILPAAVASTVGKTGGGLWFPLIPIIPPIHHHHPTSPGSPSTPSSPGTPSGPGTPVPPIIPPVAVVPEPRYGWVLALGFLAIVLTNRLRRRQA
jgi:hypothetical protein